MKTRALELEEKRHGTETHRKRVNQRERYELPSATKVGCDLALGCYAAARRPNGC